MIQKIFLNVLQSSFSTSVIILTILAVSKITSKKYIGKWRYWVWLVLSIRLVLPFSFTISNAPITLDISTISNIQMSNSVKIDNSNLDTKVQNYKHNIGYQEKNYILWRGIFSTIWFVIFLSIVIASLFSYVYYKRKLSESFMEVDETTLSLFEQVKTEVQVKRHIPIFYCGQIHSPMIMGVFSPIILLPSYTYQDIDLYFIFKHELTHFKNKDMYIKVLLLLIKALHWFNPLIRIMVKDFDDTLEMCCDEAVVLQEPKWRKKIYINTILSSIKQYNDSNMSFNTNLNGGFKTMKKRVENIMRKQKKQRGLWMLGLIICITLSATFLIGFKLKDKITYVLSEQKAHLELENAVINQLQIPEDFQPLTRYYYNYFDFNDDGVDEIFVQLVGPYTSGTGGDTAVLFQQTTNGLQPIQVFTLIHNPIIISDNKTNGWHDIIVERYGGGVKAEYVVMHYKENVYDTVNEGEAINNIDNIKGIAIISNDIYKEVEENKGVFLSSDK